MKIVRVIFISLILMAGMFSANWVYAFDGWNRVQPECPDPEKTSLYRNSMASKSLFAAGMHFYIGKKKCNRFIHDINLIESDREKGLRLPGLRAVRSHHDTPASFIIMMHID